MKTFRLLFLLTLFSIIPMFSNAQDYDIEINADKKIIHVQQLSLPGNMSVIEYLANIPELTDRNSDTFLSRYDIKYDGKIVTDSKDAILANTFLGDVKAIEITTSPSDSHIKEGISGSINIVPLPIKEGISGNAALLGYSSGVIPTVNLNYSDGKKFEMRAGLDLDIYYPEKKFYTEITAPKYTEYIYDTNKVRAIEQLARVYAKWKITDNDEFKVWIFQSGGWGKTTDKVSTTRIDDMSDKSGEGWLYKTVGSNTSNTAMNELLFAAFMEYRRVTKPGEFKFNADYHFGNVDKNKKDELNASVTSISNFNLNHGLLKFEATLNSSFISNRNFQNSMFYISPLLKLEYQSDRIKALLNGRYKGYARNYRPQGNNQFKGWSQDWTAEADVLWQIVDHHALRLKVSRSVGVASNNLVYPEYVYNESDQTWTKGNPDLLGPVTNDFELRYITDWSNGPHSIIYEVTADYNIQDRVVEYNILHDTEKKIVYKYPINNSYGGIVSLTSMLNYTYGPFSMSFGGNIFYNIRNAKYTNLKATYFNINFNPAVQLGNDWLINAFLLYNSKVYKDFATLGDAFLMDIKVSKKINNWSLFASLSNIFGGTATDVTYNSNIVEKKIYEPYGRAIAIGAKVSF